MPTPEEIKQTVAGVFDRASETYDQTGADYFATFGRILAEAADLQPGERVLDVGSGRGAVLLPAAAAVAPDGRVDGFDLAPGMVSRLSDDLVRLRVRNATVVVGDAENPPVQGPYDVVVSGLVLFFLPDPAGAVRTYHSLLRPGGRLAFSSFSRDDDRWKAVYGAVVPFVPPGGPPLRRPGGDTGPFSSDAACTEMVAAAGFSGIDHAHVAHVSTFAKRDDWWAWSWSHGMRALWERVPSAEVENAKVAAYEAIDRIRDPDGAITVRMTIRVTTAHT